MNGNADLFTIVGVDYSGQPRYGNMQHMSLQGNTGTYTGNGVTCTNRLTGFEFLDVEFKNFAGKGINLTRPWDCTYINCFFRGNQYGYYEQNSATEVCNNSRFIGCHFENNSKSHVYSSSANAGGRNLQHYFIACKFEVQTDNTANAAIYLDADQCQMIGCYLYNSNGVPLVWLNGGRNRIVGSIFSTPGESYCIRIDGSNNIVEAVDLTTTSTSKEWVSIKSGSGNKVSATVTGGAAQSIIEDLGTNNYTDTISNDNTVRRIRGDTDINISNIHYKDGVSGGTTVTMAAGITTFNVPVTQPDTNYNVFLSPRWGTTVWVSSKATNQFVVNFGTAVPTGGSTMDWFIVRK